MRRSLTFVSQVNRILSDVGLEVAACARTKRRRRIDGRLGNLGQREVLRKLGQQNNLSIREVKSNRRTRRFEFHFGQLLVARIDRQIERVHGRYGINEMVLVVDARLGVRAQVLDIAGTARYEQHLNVGDAQLELVVEVLLEVLYVRGLVVGLFRLRFAQYGRFAQVEDDRASVGRLAVCARALDWYDEIGRGELSVDVKLFVILDRVDNARF